MNETILPEINISKQKSKSKYDTSVDQIYFGEFIKQKKINKKVKLLQASELRALLSKNPNRKKNRKKIHIFDNLLDKKLLKRPNSSKENKNELNVNFDDLLPVSKYKSTSDLSNKQISDSIFFPCSLNLASNKVSKVKNKTKIKEKINSRLNVYISDELSKKHKKDKNVHTVRNLKHIKEKQKQCNKSLDKLNKKVHKNIKWVTSNCTETLINHKSKKYCQQWGTNALLELIQRIMYGKVLSCLRFWLEIVRNEKKKELIQRFNRLKASKRIAELFFNLAYRQKQFAFNTWVLKISTLQLNELMKYTILIQTRFRILIAKKRLGSRQKQAAAKVLQTSMRTFLKKQRYKNLIISVKKKQQTFALNVFKRHWKKKIYHKRLKHARACVEIQRVFRGHLGRAEAAAFKTVKVMTHSSIRIECHIRGWLCRQQLQLSQVSKAVLKLQRCYKKCKNIKRMQLFCFVKQLMFQTFYLKQEKRLKSVYIITKFLQQCLQNINKKQEILLYQLWKESCTFNFVSNFISKAIHEEINNKIIPRLARIQKHCFSLVSDLVTLSCESYLKRNHAILVLQCFFRKRRAIDILSHLLLRNRSAIVIQKVVVRHRKYRSAIMIQNFYRKQKAKAELRNLKIKQNNLSALSIQSFYRQQKTKRILSDLCLTLINRIYEEDQAALLIQQQFRIKFAKKQVSWLKEENILKQKAAIVLQCYVRQRASIYQLRAKRDLKKLLDLKRKEQAIVTLQCFVRTAIAYEQFKDLKQKRNSHLKNLKHNAAKKIQAFVKTKADRKNNKELENASRTIQKFLFTLKRKRLREKHEFNATIIQSCFRCHKCSKEYRAKQYLANKLHSTYNNNKKVKLASIVKIQTFVKEYLRLRFYNRIVKEDAASLLIQSYARRKLAFQNFRKKKKLFEASIMIQKHFRSFSQHRKEQNAVVILQSHIRRIQTQNMLDDSVILRLPNSTMLLSKVKCMKLNSAVTSIQAHCRRHMAKRLLVEAKVNLRVASSKLEVIANDMPLVNINTPESISAENKTKITVEARKTKPEASSTSVKDKVIFKDSGFSEQQQVSTASQQHVEHEKESNGMLESITQEDHQTKSSSWIECWDTTSQTTFYYNPTTKESTWQAPNGEIDTPGAPKFPNHFVGSTQTERATPIERRNAHYFKEDMLPLHQMYNQQMQQQHYYQQQFMPMQMTPVPVAYQPQYIMPNYSMNYQQQAYQQQTYQQEAYQQQAYQQQTYQQQTYQQQAHLQKSQQQSHDVNKEQGYENPLGHQGEQSLQEPYESQVETSQLQQVNALGAQDTSEETHDWDEYFDEEYGLNYYYNRVTGISTWEHPLQQ